jgi:hypothetical protein
VDVTAGDLFLDEPGAGDGLQLTFDGVADFPGRLVVDEQQRPDRWWQFELADNGRAPRQAHPVSDA